MAGVAAAARHSRTGLQDALLRAAAAAHHARTCRRDALAQLVDDVAEREQALVDGGALLHADALRARLGHALRAGEIHQRERGHQDRARLCRRRRRRVVSKLRRRLLLRAARAALNHLWVQAGRV
jgi:hypothetical protein